MAAWDAHDIGESTQTRKARTPRSRQWHITINIAPFVIFESWCLLSSSWPLNVIKYLLQVSAYRSMLLPAPDNSNRAAGLNRTFSHCYDISLLELQIKMIYIRTQGGLAQVKWYFRWSLSAVKLPARCWPSPQTSTLAGTSEFENLFLPRDSLNNPLGFCCLRTHINREI